MPVRDVGCHGTAHGFRLQPALQAPDVRAIIDPETDTGRALIDNLLTQQAQIIAFGNSFKLLMILAIIAMPFLLIIGKSGLRRTGAPAEAAAMD